MTDKEKELISIISKSKDPEQAILIAASIIESVINGNEDE